MDSINLLLHRLILLFDPAKFILLALQCFPLVNLGLNDALGPLESLLTATVHEGVEEVVFGIGGELVLGIDIYLSLAQVCWYVIFERDCVSGRGDEYHRHGHRSI